uniref:beta,beta-carotene 15,15'-dioxygenase-like n=1 Tax=Styela clava TaxID=7725 RepID=UPI0019395B3A|nr:beta,beta-carotene 15,15'-dioxygenase-like [Styela clava]
MASTPTITKFPHVAALDKDNKVEFETPIEGQIEAGQIPSWLCGTWYRNGPGMVHFNEQSVAHWFDGMSLPRKFQIKNGKVFYQSRFMKGQSYTKNMDAGRVVVPEFGTNVQTKLRAGFLSKGASSSLSYLRMIEERAASMVSLPEFTDNCLINYLYIGEHLFGISETNLVRRIDPDTLETLEKVDLSKYVPINLMSSNPIVDSEGTTYNFTTSLFSMGRTKYNLIKIPKSDPGTPFADALSKAKTVQSVDSEWRLSPSYHHSFAMSDKYAVFTEQPFKLSVPKIAMAHWTKMSYSDALEYHTELKTHFHVIDKETGNLLSTNYVTDAMIVYQHINAYEEDDHLILDLCQFDNPVFFHKYTMKNLQMSPEEYVKEFNKAENVIRAKRFVIPLNASKKSPEDENLITLPGTTCTAFNVKGNIVLTGETITENTDYPTINPKFMGKKYNYFYSTGGAVLPPGEKIMKIDIAGKKILKTWQEKGCWASRPAFIPRPNATDEDDGVILSSVHREGGNSFLLMLDGRTFEETRISFDAIIPPDLNGVFVPQK